MVLSGKRLFARAAGTIVALGVTGVLLIIVAFWAYGYFVVAPASASEHERPDRTVSLVAQDEDEDEGEGVVYIYDPTSPSDPNGTGDEAEEEPQKRPEPEEERSVEMQEVLRAIEEMRAERRLSPEEAEERLSPLRERLRSVERGLEGRDRQLYWVRSGGELVEKVGPAGPLDRALLREVQEELREIVKALSEEEAAIREEMAKVEGRIDPVPALERRQDELEQRFGGVEGSQQEMKEHLETVVERLNQQQETLEELSSFIEALRLAEVPPHDGDETRDLRIHDPVSGDQEIIQAVPVREVGDDLYIFWIGGSWRSYPDPLTVQFLD